jgi:hypothetical protein
VEQALFSKSNSFPFSSQTYYRLEIFYISI